MSRSLKKPAYVCESIIKHVRRNQEKGYSTPIKTWARSSTVSIEMVNSTLAIHNGKRHISVFVSPDMVGRKIGEFAPTRTFGGHGKAGKH